MKESYSFPVKAMNGKLSDVSFPLFASTGLLFGVKVHKEQISTHAAQADLPVCKEEQEVKIEIKTQIQENCFPFKKGNRCSNGNYSEMLKVI